MTIQKGGIPSETIQQIRERVDLVDLISSYVTLTKAGQNFKGLCPFHSEKTPSFSVNPSSQFFHCFGCQVGGDAFTFLMKQEGMDFMEALRELSQKTGVILPERRGDSSRPSSGISRERYFHVYDLASSWYHHHLQEGQEGQDAREYLQQRGISRESWKIFQLGYAPSAWNGLSKWMERQGVSIEELIQVGLVIRKEKQEGKGFSAYDRFRGRVLFPIADTKGKILGFGGRVMQGDQSPKYLNSPETHLFFKGRSLYGLDRARSSATAEGKFYLVEGYFDVIALYQSGIPNAVAPLGTALTGDHVHILRRLVSSVTLVFDGDSAGKNAALRTLDLFMNSGIEVKVVILPPGEDPDTFIRTQGVPAFRELESRASSLLNFVISSTLEGVQKDSIQDRVRRADDILRILKKTQNPLEREEYLKVVSERLGLRHDLLQKRIPTLRLRVESEKTSPKPKKGPAPEVVLPVGKAEERDIIILLLQGKLEPQYVLALNQEAFTVPVYRHILSQFLAVCDERGHVDTQVVYGMLSENPVYESVVAQLSVYDLYLEDVAGHVAGCLKNIESKRLQRRLEELIHLLKKAEREERQEAVDALNIEINDIRSQKAGLMVS